MSDRLLVVAVASRKGGVAKTTTASNLAAGLAMRGRRVLAVDADSQGHLAGALGFEDVPGALFASWAIGQPLRVCAQAQPGVYDHPLALLPGGNDSLSIAFDAAGVAALAARLRADASAMGAEFVIVDSPAVGQWQEFAIMAADLVVVPAPCTILGTQGALDAAALINDICADLPVWCLPTFYDRRLRDCRRWLNHINGAFGPASACFPVPMRVAVPDSQARGVPVVVGAKLDQSASAYMDLVDRVLDACGALPAPASVRSAVAWVVASLAEA